METNMLVLTGKKDYQCEVCENSFSQKTNLKRQILTHTKVKAHENNICKKKFSMKRNLVQPLEFT